MGQIDGLPTHVLIVHFVVVAVPLSALLLVASAVWPAARRRLVCHAGGRVHHAAVRTGGDERRRVAAAAGAERPARARPRPARRRTAAVGVGAGRGRGGDLGSGPGGGPRGRAQREPVPVGVPWPAPARATSPLTGPAARIVLAVLAVLVAAGSIVQVYRIGESGARAAWHSTAQQTPTGVATTDRPRRSGARDFLLGRLPPPREV